MNCEWCEDKIEEPIEYKSELLKACDKECAHDIKMVEKIYYDLGIYDKNIPTLEEQAEILKELDNPFGFV